MGTIERLVLGFLNSAYQDEMMTVPRGTGLAECRHSSRHILLESDLYDGRGYKYQVVGVGAPAYSLCMNLLKLSSYHDGTYPKGWHDRTLTMLSADVGILQVIIISGGPAGLATALRLKQVLNISSTIFELRPEPVTMGGAVAIPTNGLRLLDRLGLYSQVMAKAAEATDIVLHSSQGAILGRISVVSWSQQMTGFGLVRILRADLMNILLAAADEAAINVVYGADLEGIEEMHGRVTALFKDGSKAHGDLLLGCDGIHSAVRRLHVDPTCTPEYSGIANMFSLVETWKLPPIASSLESSTRP